MKVTKKRSNCPISFALENFGDRWSLLIVRDLIIEQKKTYGEFLASSEGIATNILARKLRSLEDAEIIKKTPDQNDKRKSAYALTEKGADLAPMLMEMMLWSAKYDPDTIATTSYIAKARKAALALRQI